MPDDQGEFSNPPRPEATRSGCLKWGCGGCVGLVGLMLLTGLAGWFALTRKEASSGAWNHIPPSATAALEVNGLRAMLSSGLADPGVRSLLERAWLRRAANEFLQSFSEEVLQGQTLEVAQVREALDTYGFLADPFLPDSFLLGLAGPDGEQEMFAIIRTTRGLRWLLGLGGDSGLRSFTTDDGKSVWYFSREGWLAVSQTQRVADEILAHWGIPVETVGPALTTTTPHVMAALRFRKPEAQAADPAPPPPDLPFTMSDPFAPVADPAAGNVPDEMGSAAGAAGGLLRLVLTEEGGVWTVLGVAADDGVGKMDPPPGLAAAEGLARPVAGSSATLLVRGGADVAREAQERFHNCLEKRQRTADPIWPLVKAWLTEGWLDHTAGEFALVLREPAMPFQDGVPPMPVLSLGWTLATGTNPAEAGRAFSESLATAIEFATVPGAPPPLQAVLDRIAVTTEHGAKGWGGRVSLPPVAVHSARPAWFFPATGTPAMGWLASDPTGIPDGATPDWQAVPVPSPSEVGIAMAWNISDNCRKAVGEWVADRWDLLEDQPRNETEQRFLTAAEGLTTALTVFPAGSLTATGARRDRRIHFRITIPPGKAVDW
ncbi:MAG: hypothetical protein LIP77_10710 [Planctomycetes bacterium]|nr:hypothetical protein [Planctomycetota bacterium]